MPPSSYSAAQHTYSQAGNRDVACYYVGLKEFEIRMVTERNNKQNMDWILSKILMVAKNLIKE